MDKPVDSWVDKRCDVISMSCKFNRFDQGFLQRSVDKSMDKSVDKSGVKRFHPA